VGTSLFHAHGSDFRLDEGYAQKMREAMGGLKAGEIQARVAPLPCLELQPEDRQTPFKVSYYLSPDVDHPPLLEALANELEAFRGRVQLVYSIRAGDGTGLVDVLPTGVAKDFALRYLHHATGIKSDRIVYAGDSGNDLGAMLAGFNAILVGNAEEALKDEVRRRAADEGISDRIYFSRESYAGGVLEGCRHFRIL
jgi:hydroxymethylpyrimidine pyrophosphatase-like HAD family hydrolase